MSHSLSLCMVLQADMAYTQSVNQLMKHGVNGKNGDAIQLRQLCNGTQSSSVPYLFCKQPLVS